ncbi:MAG: transporter substrate-binding domain-containing protein [Anaerobutyricum hallii]
MHIRGLPTARAETKVVDYYIGVVDDNAPYYYEEDGLPKGYYADFVAAMAKEEPFTYKFVPVDASSYNENLSKKSIDGFIGATNASSLCKKILASQLLIISQYFEVFSAKKFCNISTLEQYKITEFAATMPMTEEEVIIAKHLCKSLYKRQLHFSLQDVRTFMMPLRPVTLQILAADKELL